MKNFLENKNIVLGVCGGIAAYKTVEFLRLLKKKRANVRVIMTRNAKQFVGPTTFEALAQGPVCTRLFEKNSNPSIRHIEWAASADAVVIAPATANMIGKFANGIADDGLSTFMLAVSSQIILCPSMNTNMFESRPVQRNLKTLEQDGSIILAPGSGQLACGTSGTGRLPEPEQILDRLECALTPKDMKGLRVLVTAGPTREPIDPVRFISNPSSGKMGFAIARAAEYRGAEVVLITGPTNLPAPLNMDVINIEKAEEMANAVFEHMDHSDVIIKAAAVSDYRPHTHAEHKIKKSKDELTLLLKKTRTF
jgi:phosphopantothenoylcysteine decarboxylase/phosphopantothenate--cysteine ligase